MELSRKKLIEIAAFNRRNFIKLLVGGAVGVHLSPLPWKLMDDISIWTQNWPWVPVPPIGEFSEEKSVCTLCPGGCGIQVRKVGKLPVKIEGRTDYPVNPGGLCPLGAGGLQLLYDENIRFSGPMRRVGPRGSGKFIPLSWDEALNELANRINILRQQEAPETLVAVNGNPPRSTISMLIQRFSEAVGSPNYTTLPTADDTYSLVNRLMHGTEGTMAFDLENADFILSFGCGLIDGWGAPGRMLNAWGLWHNVAGNGKTNVVQIESRASNTASKADQWIAPVPGTEAALALGLAHVLIAEGLVDVAFLQNHAFGFTDRVSLDGTSHTGFKNLVLKKYSPSAVGRMTGLDASDIVSLAKAFGRAKAPIALFGRGKGDWNGSLYECMAIHCLNALKGNINKPGGVLIHDPLPLSQWPKIEPDGIAQRGLTQRRFDGAGSKNFPFTRSLASNLGETIVASDVSPVDTLLLFSANPAYTLPDGGTFKKALKKVPYVVSFSPYKDESSLMADLVLPDHTYLEKTEDVVWPVGLQYPLYGLAKPVVDPLYETRQSGDVLISLAKMIGGTVGASFPWSSFEEAIRDRTRGLFELEGGLTSHGGSSPIWKGLANRGAPRKDYFSFEDMWRKLKAGGLWYRPVHQFNSWETIFRTPTGKFEFSSSLIESAVIRSAAGGPMKTALEKMGVGAEGDEVYLPHYEDIPVPGKTEQYPLMMVPYSLINLASAWAPSPPYLYKTLFDDQLRKDQVFAEINPKTASEHNLKDGDSVVIESPAGKIEACVNLFEGAMPGFLYLPMGLGHTAFDDFQQNKGANPAEIILAARDPLSGHPIWWRTPVRVEKA